MAERELCRFYPEDGPRCRWGGSVNIVCIPGGEERCPFYLTARVKALVADRDKWRDLAVGLADGTRAAMNYCLRHVDPPGIFSTCAECRERPDAFECPWHDALAEYKKAVRQREVCGD